MEAEEAKEVEEKARPLGFEFRWSPPPLSKGLQAEDT
jgi:hypothetical protein